MNNDCERDAIDVMLIFFLGHLLSEKCIALPACLGLPAVPCFFPVVVVHVHESEKNLLVESYRVPVNYWGSKPSLKLKPQT